MNREDKDGTGGERRLQRCKGTAPLSILTFADGPQRKTSKNRGMARKDCAGCPHNPKLKPHPSLIPGPVEARPQLRPRRHACLFQHSGLEEGPGQGGALPNAEREGGGSGAASRLVPIWEPPPDLRGACPRLALGREGDEEPRGFASGRPD